MPAQIKLGNTQDIQTVGTVSAGTVIVPDTNNSLFLADSSNRVTATSEFYSGPTQPLGNIKMWFDTTTGQLKVNDGKSWAVQKGHTQARDHGSFDPLNAWTSLINPSYWNLEALNYTAENSYDASTNSWDASSYNEFWFRTILFGEYIEGSYNKYWDRVYSWGEDSYIVITDNIAPTQAILANAITPIKGKRFSKIRFTYTGTATMGYVYLCNVAKMSILDYYGPLVSGMELDITWPEFVPPDPSLDSPFWNELAELDVYATEGTILRLLTLEVLEV